ncbi:MAG: histidine phosphatase family protein [Deltaproteobacteria bacterium]|nr:histidine phosphatase family protein [Deltaproteobacteria bacterium]
MNGNPEKLFIAMVGLPARGKSTIASKLKENLLKDAIKTRIFNNGKLRRRLMRENTSYPEFYNPGNQEGVRLREKIALINIERAKKYLENEGNIAILDATNVSSNRRNLIITLANKYPLLFIECMNNDEEILEASIRRKIILPEFQHLSEDSAIHSFKQRIDYYRSIYNTLAKERNFVRLDSLNNKILKEEIRDPLPYYDRIRDFLVTDSVRNLFLIRHGETYFNLENRIGGDSHLTEKGRSQAMALAHYFRKKTIPVIFTSDKTRTIETAEPIKQLQEHCSIIPLSEFNEIDSGVCEAMSYEEIKEKMPSIYASRKLDKYNYVYPGGEGYVTMQERIDRGIKKALYLSGNAGNIMIVGHRAVNRMILSHFLYRRKEDVPYIYIPQDKFYHIIATQDKKLFQLKRFEPFSKS